MIRATLFSTYSEYTNKINDSALDKTFPKYKHNRNYMLEEIKTHSFSYILFASKSLLSNTEL